MNGTNNSPADKDEIAESGLVPQLAMMSRGLWASPTRNTVALLAVALFIVIAATAYGQIRLNSWNQPFYDALSRRDFPRFLVELGVFGIVAGALLVLNVGQRCVATALAVAEGRKTLQIEFSAHCLRLKRDRSQSPAHDLEGYSSNRRIVSVIVRLSRSVSPILRFSRRNNAEFFEMTLPGHHLYNQGVANWTRGLAPVSRLVRLDRRGPSRNVGSARKWDCSKSLEASGRRARSKLCCVPALLHPLPGDCCFLQPLRAAVRSDRRST
jgi:hypothetical protein